MSIKDIRIGEKFPNIVNAVIEIPKGGHNKYEYDEELDVIKMDRVLHSPLFYPVEYGFIPDTRAEDGDHLDVIVLCTNATFPGCFYEVRPLGVLNMSDENGIDHKILAVPVGHPYYKEIESIDDVQPHVIKEIFHFFEQYKKLEEKEVKVVKWGPKEEALELIKLSHEEYVKG